MSRTSDLSRILLVLQTCADSCSVQYGAYYDWFEVARNHHNGHSHSLSFIVGNEATAQQQQPQTALRARCMLVHHSNIEIDSNDSLFFLWKTHESKMRQGLPAPCFCHSVGQFIKVLTIITHLPKLYQMVHNDRQ